MTNEANLADLLGFYLKNVYRAAGLSWDSDNDAEVAQMAGLVSDISYEQACVAVANGRTFQ